MSKTQAAGAAGATVPVRDLLMQQAALAEALAAVPDPQLLGELDDLVRATIGPHLQGAARLAEALRDNPRVADHVTALINTAHHCRVAIAQAFEAYAHTVTVDMSPDAPPADA